MYHYTAIQWLFFFYFYCFFGWCFESTYVSIKSRKLVNRGFMRGPFLPLYGSGAIMMLVVGSAQVAAYMVTTCDIPQLLAGVITSMTHSALVYMLLVNILLILVGCVMDSGPAIMILTPILLPIAKQFGLDPVYFGVVMVANLCIGLCTPPVGNVLYCGVSIGKVKLSDLIKASLPFVGVMYLVLMIITVFPELILFIPNMMK